MSSAIPKLKRDPAEGVARFAGLSSSWRDRYARFMANFVDSFGYSNAYLFDTDGTVLFQLKTDLDIGSNLLTGPLKDSELAEVFDRVRTLLQIEVSDYQMYPGRSEPAAFIAGPVFNDQGLIIGFVALELGNQQVFRVFNDYSGLGDNGRDDGGHAQRRGTDVRRSATTRAGRGIQVPGADRQRASRPPCRRPCRASAATARRSTIAASRSSPPGRISLRTAGEWWSSRISTRRSR